MCGSLLSIARLAWGSIQRQPDYGPACPILLPARLVRCSGLLPSEPMASVLLSKKGDRMLNSFTNDPQQQAAAGVPTTCVAAFRMDELNRAGLRSEKNEVNLND